MSLSAHIPSHRKPRRAASSTRALRAGVTGGFLSLAVAGTTVSATAAETPAAESTLEMPTISETLASTATQTADATEQAAFGYELQAQQDQAADEALEAAKKSKAEAEARAEAKAKAEREAARKAEAERATAAAQARASRSEDRGPIGGQSAESTPAPSSNASGSVATLLDFLRAQVGKAYVSGATGPSAYDCSGLTMTAFKQIGISLPRVSQDQSTVGTQVSLDALQPGDILYWGSSGSAYHVAVYVGNGNFIGAQNSSTGVVERPLSYDMPTGAVRVL